MKDIKFYSIGRGSLNIDGKFYYGLDYAITDFMIGLEKKTNDLEHNWNGLKKWAEEYLDGARSGLDSYDCGIGDCLDDVLRKMQEIEEGGE